jgi:TIR domain
MERVLVLYAGQDKQFADTLIRALQTYEPNTTFDNLDHPLDTGDEGLASFIERVVSSLAQYSRIIALLSPEALNSPSARRVLETAATLHNSPLLLVILRRVELPLFLNTFLRIDAENLSPQRVADLINAQFDWLDIDQELGRTEPPAPAEEQERPTPPASTDEDQQPRGGLGGEDNAPPAPPYIPPPPPPPAQSADQPAPAPYIPPPPAPGGYAPPPATEAPPAPRREPPQPQPAPYDGRAGSSGKATATETLQFSVYHPNEAPVASWQTCLVYSHLAAQFGQIQADAGTFSELGSAPTTTQGQSVRKIARNVEMSVEPRVEGVSFSPAQDTFIWQGEWHRSLFRYSGAQELAGTVQRGWIDIYAERISPICTVEVLFSFHDGIARAAPSVPHGMAVTSNIFDTVFISYSHRDQEAMSQARETYEKLGVTTYHDDQLAAGDNYEQRLAEMIRAANVFHLLWSDASARSNEVRKEWVLALASAKGERFIRPWYWQQPIAPPPPELATRKISFRYEHLRRKLFNPATWF